MAQRAITAQTLRDIFTGFKTSFRGALGSSTSYYKRVATVVPSTARTEKYTWLGKWPKIREWIGDRQVNRLTSADYEITNKRFESTVAVDADDIKDDQLGIYGPMFQEMGLAVDVFPDELVFGLLKNGFTAKCYDGQPFFDDEHPVGEGQVVSNMQDGAGAPWFLLCTKRALKPLIFQDREKFDLVALDNPDDANVFHKNEFVYGTTGRCNVGFGFWQMAFGSKADLTPDNYEAARAAIMNLKDEQGRPLGLVPDLLVHGPSLEGKARRLLVNTEKAGGGTNEWAGSAEPLSVPYL